MARDREVIDRFKNEIWEQGRFLEGEGGMGGYGERFTPHSTRYATLREEDRRLYETAVLELIGDEDLARAEVGVSITDMLQEHRPPDWPNRVSASLKGILDGALPTEETGSFPFLAIAVLTRISSLELARFAPALRAYAQRITLAFMEDNMSLERWELLCGLAARALTRFSCSDGKEALSDLLGQHGLAARLDQRLEPILLDFFFNGVRDHGLDCGKELVEMVLSSRSAGVVKSGAGALRAAVEALEHWARFEGQGREGEFKSWAAAYLHD